MTEFTFFYQSCAWEQGVFHEKFEKKGHESTVFWDKISQILRKILKILKISVKSQRVWLNVKGFGQSKSQVMVIFIQLLRIVINYSQFDGIWNSWFWANFRRGWLTYWYGGYMFFGRRLVQFSFNFPLLWQTKNIYPPPKKKVSPPV